MPTDDALFSAGVSTLNTAANIAAQGNINRRTREYNEKMYNRQRADALADWTMQNEYNSPTSQMARLREAGLNPNLVYGKGADNTSQAVRSSQAQSWSPTAPRYDAKPLTDYYDIKLKQATLDNLKAQNTVQLQEAILKATTTANISQQTAKTSFELGMAQQLKDNSLEMASESLRKLKVGTDIALQENERAAAMNSSNLVSAATAVLKMRADIATSAAQRQEIQARISNLQTDSKLKQLDYEMRSMGIQPNDNMFMRVLGRIINGDVNIDLPKLRDFKKGGKYSFNKVLENFLE